MFFIDEIHRLSSVVEEYLYSAMEDYNIDIMIDMAQMREVTNLILIILLLLELQPD